MPITLQYGANPTVAMMAAYQGGKNAYRNKQEEEYRRLYMQQQQLQQQAQLQREHMGYQAGMALTQMQNQWGEQGERLGQERELAQRREEFDAARLGFQGGIDLRGQDIAFGRGQRQAPGTQKPGAGVGPPNGDDPIGALPPGAFPQPPPAAPGLPAQPDPIKMPDFPKAPKRPQLAPGLGGYYPQGMGQQQPEQITGPRKKAYVPGRGYQIVPISEQAAAAGYYSEAYRSEQRDFAQEGRDRVARRQKQQQKIQSQPRSLAQTRYDPHLGKMVSVANYRSY